MRFHRHEILFGTAALVISLAVGVRPMQAAPPQASPSGLFSPPSTPLPYDPASTQQRLWMTGAAIEVRAVRVGMTRAQMAGVFERAGGASAARATTPLLGVYSLRKCPYFKVNVEFSPVCKPQRDKLGDVWTLENPKDVITKISQPYLQQVYSD